tara:strand:+ start:28 stop:585 length:558 start_codon:yes stop_codon:yes gene_type:complete
MWCNVGFAEDISKYQIEGISLGDSLLDHLSKEEIIDEIENNKPDYNYLSDDFGEVYLYGNFDIYERLSFFVKPKDKYYTIYAIYGSISYDDKLEQCFSKQKDIEKEISSKYKNFKKKKYSRNFPWDPTGESTTHNITFYFNSGQTVDASCTKYKKSLKIENNWDDSFSFSISKKVIDDWFSNRIN